MVVIRQALLVQSQSLDQLAQGLDLLVQLNCLARQGHQANQ